MAESQIAASAAAYQCKTCELKKGARDFYPSNLSKCKECVKRSVRENRVANIEYFRAYDRQRYRESDVRKEAAKKSAQSEAGLAARMAHAERTKGTEKRKARVAIGNAVTRGAVERGRNCFFCDAAESLQAHHPDYARPYDVFWLCPKCHGKLHTINGDFLRGPKP